MVDHGNFIAQEKLSFYTEENKTKIQKYCDDNKGNFYVISLVVPVLYNMFPKLLKFSAGLYPCFVWEFDALPKAWSESIQMVNNKIVKFVSACSWNKEVIERCTNKKSVVIPYTVKPKVEPDTEYTNKIKELLNGRYTFCMVGELQDRKGYDILLKSFLTEFKDDNVNLIMKCYTDEVHGIDSQQTIDKANNLILSVKKLITSYGSTVDGYNCNIVVIPGLISEEKLSSIYDVSDCFVTCTRGEGFGIPMADFMVHHKKPVISPDKGGHLDFIAPSSPLIESRFTPYFSEESKHHATCDMNYVDPSILSARKQMRNMYQIGKNNDKYSQICDTMYSHAKEYLDSERIVQMFKNLLGV